VSTQNRNVLLFSKVEIFRCDELARLGFLETLMIADVPRPKRCSALDINSLTGVNRSSAGWRQKLGLMT
jgi:hypothetical protein